MGTKLLSFIISRTLESPFFGDYGEAYFYKRVLSFKIIFFEFPGLTYYFSSFGLLNKKTSSRELDFKILEQTSWVSNNTVCFLEIDFCKRAMILGQGCWCFSSSWQSNERCNFVFRLRRFLSLWFFGVTFRRILRNETFFIFIEFFVRNIVFRFRFKILSGCNIQQCLSLLTAFLSLILGYGWDWNFKLF